MKELLKEMFEILDVVEVSDEGREFRPNKFVSCRAMDGERLGQILNKLKDAVETSDENVTFSGINRFEAIDNDGRSFVAYDEYDVVEIHLQDNNKTMKVFLK